MDDANVPVSILPMFTGNAEISDPRVVPPLFTIPWILEQDQPCVCRYEEAPTIPQQPILCPG